MQIKKIKAMMAGLVIMGLTFTACSGEDGEDGVTGATGATGATGNANVISNQYVVADTSWAGGDATIEIPALTKSIADNGIVAVYATFDSLATDSITWRSLPYKFVGNVGGTGTFIDVSYTFNIGEVTLSARLPNNAPINLFTTSCRVVLIPSSARVNGANIDNYEEVKMIYGIKEFDVQL